MLELILAYWVITTCFLLEVFIRKGPTAKEVTPGENKIIEGASCLG